MWGHSLRHRNRQEDKSGTATWMTGVVGVRRGRWGSSSLLSCVIQVKNCPQVEYP